MSQQPLAAGTRAAAQEDETDPSSSSWTCSICTFAGNPALFLSCAVCQGERSSLAAPTTRTGLLLLPARASSSATIAPPARTATRRDAPRATKIQPPSSSSSSVAGLSPSTTVAAASSDGNAAIQNLDDDDSSSSLSVELLDQPSLSFRNSRVSNNQASSASSMPTVCVTAKSTTNNPQPKLSGLASNRRMSSKQSTAAAVDGKGVSHEEEEMEEEENARRRRWHRCPPAHTAVVRNLSDPEYCCVWSIEVLDGSYRPDVARTLLATVARHVNPVLRARGWRVKRLLESCSSSWIGLCTTNGRNDADSASVNIQLNLRTQPNRQCRQFRTFAQILAVMLHEITHTSIGLEDIHPPAFWELLSEVRLQYQSLLNQGEVAAQARHYNDDDFYKCHETTVLEGRVVSVCDAARQLDRHQHLGLSTAVAQASGSTTGDASAGPESLPPPPDPDPDLDVDQCGASRRRKRRWRRRRSAGGPSSSRLSTRRPRKPPLLKGARMVDGRTKAGKAVRLAKERLTPHELAARAALSRLGPTPTMDARMIGGVNTGTDASTNNADEDDNEDFPSDGSSHDSSSDEDAVAPHTLACGCRSCQWDQMLHQPTGGEGTNS